MISRWLVVPIKRNRNRPKGDPQRHKIYSLERELVGMSVNTRCPRDHLRDVLAHACRKYRVTAAELKFIRNPDMRIFGFYIRYPFPSITLNSGFHGCNMFTLMHELAHHIVDERFDSIEHHGPEFAKVYMDLLHRYRIIPNYAFKVMLERYGVKF